MPSFRVLPTGGALICLQRGSTGPGTGSDNARSKVTDPPFLQVTPERDQTARPGSAGMGR